MSNSEFRIRDLAHLPEAARWLLEQAEGYQYLAFYGDLGAGKTTLIQELCKQSGVIGGVTSPTFALVNEYNVAGNEVIYHFDFYRLNTPEEVLDIGFEDYLSSDNRCFMEWPEKVGPYLPLESLKIFIEVQPDNSRIILLEIPSMA